MSVNDVDVPGLPPAYRDFVAQRAAHFTGREWVFGSLDDWLDDPAGGRYFVITAPPGSGKTALSARLTQISLGQADAPAGLRQVAADFLSAVYFCGPGDLSWANPLTFVGLLAQQLAQRYRPFAEAFQEVLASYGTHINISQIVDKADDDSVVVGAIFGNITITGMRGDDAFASLVHPPLDALARQQPDRPIVLVVDGLDEALEYERVGPGRNAGIPTLVTQVDHLPPNVRFILTTRPDPDLLLRLAPSEPREYPLNAPAVASLNHQDVARYVRDTLARQLNLRARLVPGLTPAALAAEIAERSAGNFLYVMSLLRLLSGESGRIDHHALDAWPRGLNPLYLTMLRRIVGNDGQRWRRELGPVLGVLTVAREPMTEATLAALVGMSRSEVRWPLADLATLLDADPATAEDQRAYALFHRSFAELLLDRRRAGIYWCEPDEQHRRIVAAYAATCEGDWPRLAIDPYAATCEGDWPRLAIDPYARRHLVAHLTLAGEWPTAIRLVTELPNRWAAARYDAEGSYAGYVADLALVWGHAEETGALGLQVRCALIAATIANLSGNIPPELLVGLVVVGTPRRRLSPEAAFNLVSQMPESSRRVEAYHLLVQAMENIPIGPARQAAEAIDDPTQRADALTLLATRVADDQRAAICRAALAAIQAIADDDAHLAALKALAPHLHPDAADDALTLADGLRNPDAAVLARGSLLRGMPADRLHEVALGVLGDAGQLSGDHRRARAILAMADGLPDDLLGDALGLASGCTDPFARAWSIATLLPRFGPDRQPALIEEALRAVAEIPEEDDSLRADALIRVVGRTPAERRSSVAAAALEAVRAIPMDWRGERAILLAELAGLLQPDEGLAVADEALAAIGDLTDPWFRVELLVRVAPDLPSVLWPAVYTRVLDLLATERALPSVSSSLAAIIRHLPDGQVGRAFGLASVVTWSADNYKNVLALAPRLPPDLVPAAERFAAALSDPYDESRLLAVLSSTRPLEEQPEEFADLWAWANLIADVPTMLDALMALAPHVSIAQREPLVAELFRMYEQVCNALTASACAETLATITQALPVQCAERAWRLADDIEPGKVKAWLRAALVPTLPPARRAAARESALAEACAVEDGPERARSLVALMSIAPKRRQSALVEQALAAVCENRGTSDDANVVVDLVATLPVSFRQAGLAAIRAATEAIPHEGVRNLLLFDWARSTDEARVAAAGALADTIRDPQDRAEMLKDLAERLPVEQQPAAYAAAASAALQITDDEDRTRLLIELHPRLDAEERPNVSAALLDVDRQPENPRLRVELYRLLHDHLTVEEQTALLTELAPRSVRHRGKVADIIRAIKAFPRAEGQAALWSKALDDLEAAPEPDAFDDALWFASRELPNDLIPLTYDRATERTATTPLSLPLLASLFVRLPAEQQAASWASLVAEFRTANDEQAVRETLATLGQALLPAFQDEVRSLIARLGDVSERAHVLLRLARATRPSERASAFAAAAEAARQIPDDKRRAEMLTALAPELGGDRRRQALADALDALAGTVDERERGVILAQLIPDLDQSQLPAAQALADRLADRDARLYGLTLLASRTPDALPGAFAVACRLDDPGDRADAIVNLVTHLERWATAEPGRRAMAVLLRATARHDRAELLEVLIVCLPLLARIGGAALADEIWQALDEVTAVWP